MVPGRHAVDAASIQGGGFTGVKVVDEEIEEPLLSSRSLGPCGCEVVLDFLKGQSRNLVAEQFNLVHVVGATPPSGSTSNWLRRE